jgi:SGNH hydrolase-like domain, acetyltransferase AlgX
MLLGVTWALSLLQLLTIVPSVPFVLLEPGSASLRACVLLFLAGSPGLLAPARLRPLVAVHLAAVGLAIAAHPLTWPFGRDGSIVVLSLHCILVIAWRTSWRTEVRLALGTSLLALLIAETALSSLREATLGGPPGALDYGDVMGAYGPGGFLKPNLDVRVVGPGGSDVSFVTNALGFRQRRPLAVPKPARLRRIFLVGDSFVAGYRTDQDATLGHVLEAELARRERGDVEVMIAGAGHPGAARELVENHLLDMEPDAILVAITLGNDISQAWFEGRRLPATVLDGPLLPADAFPASELALLPVRIDRTLRSFRVYRRLALLLQRDVIQPWFHDHPRRVHLFDPGHSLGHFYARRPLDLVEQSYAALFSEMDALAASCGARAVPLQFLVVPQRFQVDPDEWRATTFRLGLDPTAFDLERPNRFIADHCRAAGLRCLDLLPAMRSTCADAACYQPLGDMHWNARGQARAALTVADALSAGPRPAP